MPELEDIYAEQAEQYQQLVAREDYEGNILRAIQVICPLDGIDVIEFGAGTGRLTLLLTPLVRSIQAFDASPAMLDVARSRLMQGGYTNWRAEVAGHDALPVPDGAADLAIGGWTICYAALWSKGDWRADLGGALAEMRRVLRPGGRIVILETLGTGYTEPHPPDILNDYFAYLEGDGFASTAIRTDYRFESQEEAETLTRFFFGDELADRVKREKLTILPECTGVWWKQV